MTLDLSASLGIAHLLLVLTGCTLFLTLIGLCCPSWDEPYPRVVQLAYPSSNENRWFLMHVSRTALRRNWYVSSISQFVGARGTTGAKLMMLMTTTLSLSSIYIQSLLWTEGSIPTVALVLSVISSFGLGTLGFCESALEWAPLPVDYPVLETVAQEKMDAYYKQLEITRLTEEEDTTIKSQFSTVHMISAFTFILGQFSSQVCTFSLYHNQTESGFIVACIGMGLFLIFCLMQWISGANDSMLLGSSLLSRFAVFNMSRLQCCYYPQMGTLSPAVLKRVSWSFILVELGAFSLIASCPGWSALHLS